jgi:hypothetical protein
MQLSGLDNSYPDRQAGNDSTGNSFAVDALQETLIAEPEPECSLSRMGCVGGVYAEPEGARGYWIDRDQSGSCCHLSTHAISSADVAINPL